MVQWHKRDLPEEGPPLHPLCEGGCSEGDPSTENHLTPITACSCLRNHLKISLVRHGTLW